MAAVVDCSPGPDASALSSGDTTTLRVAATRAYVEQARTLAAGYRSERLILIIHWGRRHPHDRLGHHSTFALGNLWRDRVPCTLVRDCRRGNAHGINS